MAENLMNSAHKSTNKAFRDNWDRIFGGVPKLVEGSGLQNRLSLVQIQPPPQKQKEE